MQSLAHVSYRRGEGGGRGRGREEGAGGGGEERERVGDPEVMGGTLHLKPLDPVEYGGGRIMKEENRAIRASTIRATGKQNTTSTITMYKS